ncbi:hypothetical protein [Dokdonella fugitiva]|nr:hypothetical protein [Dokdonella fugitiva]
MLRGMELPSLRAGGATPLEAMRAYAAPARMRNARGAPARGMPELVAITARSGRRASSRRRCNEAAHRTGATTMNPSRPDPNAELHARERLRIVFALGSLLLGLLAAVHM